MAEVKTTINAPSIVNNYPQSASVISKLTKADSQPYINPAMINLKDISTSVREKIATNEDILELFPDVELAIQILTSSILSPNDMVNITLQYIPPNISLPSNVKQTLIDTFERHMNDNYDIVTKLPNILRESLFTKGAYIEVIIPEASLDDIITQNNLQNMSLEDYMNRTKHISKYLGKDNVRYGISLESMGNPTTKMVDIKTGLRPNEKFIEITQEDMGISITDNVNILLYSSKIINSKRNNMSMSHESDEAILDRLFRSDSSYAPRDYLEIPTRNNASRESITKPLVMKLPVEAVIPIHVTSDPSKHLGYFVILDENGNPISIKEGMRDYQEAMSNMTFLNQNNATSLIQKANLALKGLTKEDPIIKELEPIYNSIVENMIKNKIKNGLYGDLVDINDNADIFRVMLVRSLRAQQTKILFIPEELVAYYAFEYRDNGTGKSLLEKNTLLYSIRAILLFSRLMANIKNSVTNTVVSATLDEHDPDPEATREKIISESLKTRQASLPLGLIRPDDLTEWTHKVGFLYKINHPALPNIDLDVSDQSPNKTVPDEELDNKLAERILMSYGLTPEIVMAGYSSDFATTVASRNLLFAKRCTSTQLVFMAQVTKHIQKIAKNDITLTNKLETIIKSNIKDIKKVIKNSDNETDDVNLKKISENKIIDYLINKYINYIDIKLPSIVFTDANVLRSTFDTFLDNLNVYLDNTITSTIYTDMYGGKLNEQIDTVKEIIKGMVVTKWANNNNFMPEVNEIFTRDDEGNPEFDIFAEFLNYKDSLNDLLIPFIKRVTKSRDKYDGKLQEVLDKLQNVGQDSGSYDSGGYDQPADDSGDTPPEGDQGDTPPEGGDGGAPEGMEGMDDMGGADDTGGQGEGGGEGGDQPQDAGGGDDLDMGGLDDMRGMGDDGSQPEGQDQPEGNQVGYKRGTRSEGEVKLNEELLAAKIEKQKADAEKAKIAAAKAKKVAQAQGIDIPDSDDQDQDNQDDNQQQQEGDEPDDNQKQSDGTADEKDQQANSQGEEEKQQQDQKANEAYQFDLARVKVL